MDEVGPRAHLHPPEGEADGGPDRDKTPDALANTPKLVHKESNPRNLRLGLWLSSGFPLWRYGLYDRVPSLPHISEPLPLPDSTWHAVPPQCTWGWGLSQRKAFRASTE